MVAVEGLKPLEGGRLTFAVLEKSILVDESSPAEATFTTYRPNIELIKFAP